MPPVSINLQRFLASNSSAAAASTPRVQRVAGSAATTMTARAPHTEAILSQLPESCITDEPHASGLTAPAVSPPSKPAVRTVRVRTTVATKRTLPLSEVSNPARTLPIRRRVYAPHHTRVVSDLHDQQSGPISGSCTEAKMFAEMNRGKNVSDAIGDSAIKIRDSTLAILKESADDSIAPTDISDCGDADDETPINVTPFNMAGPSFGFVTLMSSNSVNTFGNQDAAAPSHDSTVLTATKLNPAARAELTRLIQELHHILQPTQAHALISALPLLRHACTDAVQALRLIINELRVSHGLRQRLQDGSLSVANYLTQERTGNEAQMLSAGDVIGDSTMVDATAAGSAAVGSGSPAAELTQDTEAARDSVDNVCVRTSVPSESPA